MSCKISHVSGKHLKRIVYTEELPKTNSDGINTLSTASSRKIL